jgi:hypothetical protein
MGNAWTLTFQICVNLLEWGAKVLDPIWPGGMDYVKINVIIFCILLPVILAVSIGLNVLWALGLI